MDDPLHKAKLAKLFEIEGYNSVDELMEALFSDASSANHPCTFRPVVGHR
jgi:hypothetical protein